MADEPGELRIPVDKRVSAADLRSPGGESGTASPTAGGGSTRGSQSRGSISPGSKSAEKRGAVAGGLGKKKKSGGGALANSGAWLAAKEKIKKNENARGGSTADKKKAADAGKVLDSIDVRVRLKTLKVFHQLPEIALEPWADIVAKKLWDPKLEVRQAAAFVLGRFPKLATRHAESLADRMGYSDIATVKNAGQTLAFMGEAGHKSLMKRLEGLNEQAYKLQERVGPALAYTPDQKAAAAELEKVNAIRRETIDALSIMKEEAGRAHAGSISDLLGDSDDRVVMSSTRCLGEFRQSASDFVPILSKGLKNMDPEFRLQTAKAMGQIGTASAPYANELVDELHPSWFDGAPSLKDPREKLIQQPLRFTSASSLLLMQEAAADAMAARLNHVDARVRASVIQGLGQIPDDSYKYSVAISDKLNEHDPIIRSRAAEALGNMGAEGALHAAQLAALLWDTDSGVRHVAREALQKVVDAAGMDYNQMMHAISTGEIHMERQAKLDNPLAAKPPGKDKIGLHKYFEDDGSETYHLRVNPDKPPTADYHVPVGDRGHLPTRTW